MIDRAEVVRRMEQILSQASSLGEIKVKLPEGIPGKERFLEDFVQEIEWPCVGGNVTFTEPATRDKRTGDDSTTEWIWWTDNEWFPAIAECFAAVEDWFQSALTASDAIYALIAESEAFRPFKGGRAKGLDREQWRPGMHDAEARGEIAREIHSDVIDWYQNFLTANQELPVINFFILTGLEEDSRADPCGEGGNIFYFIRREGPWYEMEKDRLEAALGAWHTNTGALISKMQGLPARFAALFDLFARGTQTAGRGF